MSVRRAPRVLVVCLGNICRSPTGEAAIRTAAAERGLEVEVSSAGTGDWHVGERADPRMRAAAAQGGLTLDGRARQVSVHDLAEADLVLAMDRANLEDLRVMAGSADVRTPIRLFRDFDPEGAGSDVPDPYTRDPEAFTAVVAICRRTAAALVDVLAQRGPDDAEGFDPRAR